MFAAFIVTVIATVAMFSLWTSMRKSARNVSPDAKSARPDGSLSSMFSNLLPKAAAVVGVLAAGFAVLSLVFLFGASTYRQDVGESNVRISWTGSLQGQTTEPGLHFIAPWDHISTWDVRNNTVSFIATGETNHISGGSTDGPSITFTDSSNTPGNMDIVVRYSIKPDAVLALYTDFKTQGVFVTNVIENELRGQTRVIASARTTDEMLQGRAAFEALLTDSLGEQWADEGVVIEYVTVRSVLYSAEVMTRYDEAQQARVKITTAEADQKAALVLAETERKVAEIDAEKAIIKAQGEATANDIKNASLTPAILQQMYIDALKEGTIYVVPDGSTPFIGAK